MMNLPDGFPNVMNERSRQNNASGDDEETFDAEAFEVAVARVERSIEDRAYRSNEHMLNEMWGV